MQISVYNFYTSIFQSLFNNGNNVKLYYSIIFFISSLWLKICVFIKLQCIVINYGTNAVFNTL